MQNASKFSHSSMAEHNPRPRLIDSTLVPAARKGLSSPWAVSCRSSLDTPPPCSAHTWINTPNPVCVYKHHFSHAHTWISPLYILPLHIFALSSFQTTQDDGVTSFSTEHREKFLVLVEDEGGNKSESSILDPRIGVRDSHSRVSTEAVGSWTRNNSGVEGVEGGLCLPHRDSHSPDSLLADSWEAPQNATLRFAQETSSNRAKSRAWESPRAVVAAQVGGKERADIANRGGGGRILHSRGMQRVCSASSNYSGSGATSRGVTPHKATPRATTCSSPRTAAAASGSGERERGTPRANSPMSSAARGGGAFQPAKGGQVGGGGRGSTASPRMGGEGGLAVSQAMVAGAGPSSPAKGDGDVMKGDQGTWSPFFRNQVSCVWVCYCIGWLRLVGSLKS